MPSLFPFLHVTHAHVGPSDKLNPDHQSSNEREAIDIENGKFANATTKSVVRGLPYMTSAVGGGGGSPKSRRKEQNQLICDSDKGEGVNKSENFADVIYGSPLMFFSAE